MKKLIPLLSLVLSLSSLSFTQISVTEAVDFTANDLEGASHNLFSYLKAGNYVLLDFNRFN